MNSVGARSEGKSKVWNLKGKKNKTRELLESSCEIDHGDRIGDPPSSGENREARGKHPPKGGAGRVYLVKPAVGALDCDNSTDSGYDSIGKAQGSDLVGLEDIPFIDEEGAVTESVPSDTAAHIERTSSVSTGDTYVFKRDRVVVLSREPSPLSSPCPLAALRMNLSFCGCGFLGIYHLGVARVLAAHGSKLLVNVQRYCGASAGALVAAVLAVRGADQAVIDESVAFTLALADTVSRRALGVLTPRLSLLADLDRFLRRAVPDDGHVTASGRLHVSVTTFRTKENELVSQFESKDHLIKCLLASSYVPFATGTKPVLINGTLYMDGGITDNLPEPPEGGTTIFVSPFSGNQHICPRDVHRRQWFSKINGQDFQVTQENIQRGLHAFFPPKRSELERYYEQGMKDAERFLKERDMWTDSAIDNSSEATENMNTEPSTKQENT